MAGSKLVPPKINVWSD